jgi:hypothetical protein
MPLLGHFAAWEPVLEAPEYSHLGNNEFFLDQGVFELEHSEYSHLGNNEFFLDQGVFEL